MYSFKTNILYFTLLNVFDHVQNLVELPAVEDNNIAITERTIRDTVNDLFAAFKIKNVKQNIGLKQYSTIHNFFASITLTDLDNLKQISRLTRVNDVDNNTIRFIALLNEVLDDDGKSEEVNDIYVTAYIETFINKLRDLKGTYKIDDGYTNSAIDAKILKYLNPDVEISSNVTDDIETANNFNDNVLIDYQYWRPEQQSGRRIYKGQKTRIKYFPFMASIHAFKKFQCAGSIIHSDLIITAASCLQLAWNNRFFRDNPSFLSVQIGSDYYEAGGQYITVQEIHFHPGYDPNLMNNLALLSLTSQILFSKDSKLIKKIEMDQTPSPLPSYIDRITIVGWGATGTKDITNELRNERLTFAILDYYTLIDCQEIYTKEYVTRKNFCAGFYSKGSGACNRDIGGPGIVDGVLMGVVSFGAPACGTPDAPTVFTKIGFYKNWIQNVIDKVTKSKHGLNGPMEPMFTLNNKNVNADAITSALNETFDEIPKNLKIVQDDKLFKEFLSNVWSSNKGNDNIEPRHNEDLIEPKIEITTETVTRKDISLIDTVKAKSDDKIISFAKNTNPKDHTSQTEPIERAITPQPANTILTINDDVNLENDISDLLKDLDIYKLLESSDKQKNTTRTVVKINDKPKVGKREKDNLKTFLFISHSEEDEYEESDTSSEYSNKT